VPLLPAVQAYLDARIAEFGRIPASRRTILDALGTYVSSRVRSGEPCRLTFICTHNSRRSHFGQVWAGVAGAHFRIPDLSTYSGGTQATAFHPHAIAALRRAGLRIEPTTDGPNPIHLVRFAPDAPPIACFSKACADAPNPASDFAAIMTCAEADAACPIVPGAAIRLPIPYADPKDSDGTPDQDAAYDDRCAQIARETAYALSRTSLSV
jgi:hypothetical protein